MSQAYELQDRAPPSGVGTLSISSMTKSTALVSGMSVVLVCTVASCLISCLFISFYLMDVSGSISSAVAEWVRHRGQGRRTCCPPKEKENQEVGLKLIWRNCPPSASPQREVVGLVGQVSKRLNSYIGDHCLFPASCQQSAFFNHDHNHSPILTKWLFLPKHDCSLTLTKLLRCPNFANSQPECQIRKFIFA